MEIDYDMGSGGRAGVVFPVFLAFHALGCALL